MSDTVTSILVGTVGLDVAFLAAILVTAVRTSPRATESVRRAVAWALLAQTVHFSEEAATGFHRAFPELLGLAPWPPSFFLALNLTWIVIWIACLVVIRRGHRLVWIPIWFLSIAGIMNGLAHPALSIAAGGYFPGLWTSPLVAAAGFVLAARLVSTTSPG